MSYSTERAAIAAYFNANWVGAIGHDAHDFTPAAGSIMLTIASGAVLQGSIGRTANRIDHIGTLTVSIFTEGGTGSDVWRKLADTLQGLLFDKRLTTAGALATTPGSTFIRFSPPELGENRHPYIGASFPVPPLHQTNLIAPFVRYEFR
ncbi:MAG: hypothetical protein E6R03_02755 [Hyphomicrobiaceae bacterium]|nr:MAG: hypothetical protein E6R03_02755 [Hyphomicrobiaceae bacterium]